MKRFLSLILALTLVASFFTVNVMADSIARTVTVTANKTTDLKAGDIVTVEITIDTVASLNTIDYELLYDVDAFVLDETLGWEDAEDEEMKPNYIDQEWYDGVFDGPIKRITGNKLLNKPSDGTIFVNFAGGTKSVKADVTDTDVLIGKFHLIVKNDVQDGTYNIGLNEGFKMESGVATEVPACNTMDDGEQTVTRMISTPVTVTVGEEKQEATPSISTAAPTATGAGIAVEREDGTQFTYDNCYTVTVKMTNTNEATKAGIQFIPALVLATNGNSWDDAAEAVFTTGLGAGEDEFTAALINIPRKFAGQDITMKARGFMVVDGAKVTGTEVESVVNYTVTAEPGQN